jgi:S1-C subfamily serine protease
MARFLTTVASLVVILGLGVAITLGIWHIRNHEGENPSETTAHAQPRLVPWRGPVDDPDAGGPSSGTGFVVAAGGRILTNRHVVSGHGTVSVSFPHRKDPVPARVLARDALRDLALIEAHVPEGVDPRPLRLSGSRTVQRGERVAAFGYPLGTVFGQGLKLTTGVVTALPERGNDNMLLLDAKVNPGNSGGPLCDSSGNVVGMITRMTIGHLGEGLPLESYGLAIPGNELDRFVRQHVSDFKPVPSSSRPLGWEEIDRQVSDSVVMIVQE